MFPWDSGLHVWSPRKWSLSIFYWGSSDVPRPAGATGSPLSLCCTGSARSTSTGLQCPGQRAGRWHQEVTQSPKQCLPSPIPSPRALVGGHCWVLETHEHQGAFPGPGWFLHPRDVPCPAWARHYLQCSAARAPLVLQTTEWHFSITQKWSNFYNCLSKWCIKWKDNLFL